MHANRAAHFYKILSSSLDMGSSYILVVIRWCDQIKLWRNDPYIQMLYRVGSGRFNFTVCAEKVSLQSNLDCIELSACLAQNNIPSRVFCGITRSYGVFREVI